MWQKCLYFVSRKLLLRKWRTIQMDKKGTIWSKFITPLWSMSLGPWIIVHDLVGWIMILAIYWNNTDMIFTWYWHAVKAILTWYWQDVDMILTAYWQDIDMQNHLTDYENQSCQHFITGKQVIFEFNFSSWKLSWISRKKDSQYKILPPQNNQSLLARLKVK